MIRFMKRAISWILILAMTFSQPLVSFAESLPETTEINGQMLDDVPEDDNYVYMGRQTVTLSEGNGIFEIPIYRTGDLDKSVSVTIHALSFTAQYGKDYVIMGKNKTLGYVDYNIMELIAGKGSTDDASNDLKLRRYQYSYEEVAEIGRLAKKYNVAILADELYSRQILIRIRSMSTYARWRKSRIRSSPSSAPPRLNPSAVSVLASAMVRRRSSPVWKSFRPSYPFAARVIARQPF